MLYLLAVLLQQAFLTSYLRGIPMQKKPSKKVVAFFNNPPEIVTGGDDNVIMAFKTFLSVRLKNGNSVEVYCTAIIRFLNWCCEQKLSIKQLDHHSVVGYQEVLDAQFSPAYVNVQLSAIRTFCDWFMQQGCIPANPAVSIRSSGQIVKASSVPLTHEQVAQLLDSVDISNLKGLRNRAVLGAIMHGFISTSDLVELNRGDYIQRENRWWFNLGKQESFRQIPANSELAGYMEEYLAAVESSEANDPLFIALSNTGVRSRGARISTRTVQRIVGECAVVANLNDLLVTPRSLRATGIRNFLRTGGNLEKAQQIAGHRNPITTSAYREESDRQVIYEGDLDGLVNLLNETETGPLQEFIKRSGIFRVTLQSSEVVEEE